MINLRLWWLLIYSLSVAVVIVFILAIDDQSHLLIKFGGIEFQARLWALVLFILVILPLVIKIIKLTLTLLSGSWFLDRLEENNNKKLKSGILAYLEGDYYTAVNSFKPLNKKPGANKNILALIFGAKAAEKINNRDLTDEWLNKAILSNNVSAKFSAKLSRIKITLDRRQYKEALRYIDELELHYRQRPEVIKQTVIALLKSAEWQKLQQLMHTQESEVSQIFGAGKVENINRKLQQGLANAKLKVEN